MAFLKTIFIVAAVGVVGYYAYIHFVGARSPAVQAYKEYAEAIARGDSARAAPVATEHAEYMLAGLAVPREQPSEVRFRGVKERPTSETGDEVEVEATMILRDSIGMTRNLLHRATVRNVKGTWRVASLQETAEVQKDLGDQLR